MPKQGVSHRRLSTNSKRKHRRATRRRWEVRSSSPNLARRVPRCPQQEGYPHPRSRGTNLRRSRETPHQTSSRPPRARRSGPRPSSSRRDSRCRAKPHIERRINRTSCCPQPSTKSGERSSKTFEVGLVAIRDHIDIRSGQRRSVDDRRESGQGARVHPDRSGIRESCALFVHF